MRPHPKAKGNPYQRRLFVGRVLEQGWSVASNSEPAYVTTNMRHETRLRCLCCGNSGKDGNSWEMTSTLS